MKKRVNISIGVELHARALQFARSKEMDFSELVSSLLREMVDSQVTTATQAKPTAAKPLSATSLEPETIHPVPDFLRRLADGEKPSRNRPCPCGSGEKYKHCCAEVYPYVWKTPKKSCNVSEGPIETFDEDENEESSRW